MGDSPWWTLVVLEAGVEELQSRADDVVGQLDELIRRRRSKRESLLASWDAPNRQRWEDDNVYAQLDLQAAIDEVQGLKSAVANLLEAVVEQ